MPSNLLLTLLWANAAKPLIREQSMKTNVDVIVVGAGIVGQALALGLAKQSLKVAVVDKGPEPSFPALDADFSVRVSAISSASEQMLRALGAWQFIQRKQAYTHMQVWDKDGFGHIAFDASETNSKSEQGANLGHIIENEQLNAALQQALSQNTHGECVFDSNIQNMYANEDSAQVILENGRVIEGKLLVGADGANSSVRNAFGFKQTFWDYEHTAIVANVKTATAHQNTAKQAFTPYGPLAFLPMAEANTSSIVFSQQSEQAAELMAMSNAEFEKALRVAIDNQYGEVSLLSQRSAIPLRMRYARQWIDKRVALVGDAAHTIHPLAGQGANLGLADAQSLLSLVEAQPQQLGEFSQLRKYERWRKAEALKVIASMEGFKRLFDGQQPLKKFIRNTGLLAANKLPLVKQFFIQQASS